MRIGYGRASTRDQNPDGQRDALVGAGCDEILVDKASGKLARRTALDQALLIARAGDQLVITKLGEWIPPSGGLVVACVKVPEGPWAAARVRWVERVVAVNVDVAAHVRR